jgi:hypothetical protein
MNDGSARQSLARKAATKNVLRVSDRSVTLRWVLQLITIKELNKMVSAAKHRHPRGRITAIADSLEHLTL